MGKLGTATATGLLDSRGSSGSARADSVDVPWQQFGDPIDGVIGDAGKHVAQVGFGVEAVQFRRLDQRVHGGGPLAAAVGAGEEPILSAQSNRPVILPMSGRRSRSIIAGTHCMGVAFDASMS